MARNLPTFEDRRSNAFALLFDADDELSSEWQDGTGPTQEQAKAVQEARQAIAQAKAALDRAGR